MPEAANLVFLPWVRQGAAAGIVTPDSFGPGQPPSVKLDAVIDLNGVPGPTVPVRLFGPADVLGVDPRQIVRMDPPPASADFEPNYLVAIEFDRPDFPWLFTPAQAGVNDKLRPWLVLVVVRRQPGVTLRPALDAPLPTIEIAGPAQPADELPDLAESMHWAHAQAASGVALTTALAERSELSLSRLLCPRRLEPTTDYVAALVPAFELGRKAGLGIAPAAAELDRLDAAWRLTPKPAAITLPMYHHWSFRTGEGGDFESLVRLLKAQGAPPDLGLRPVAIGSPGFALPDGFPADATLDVGGALMAADASTEPAPWPEGAEAPFVAALAGIVNEPGLAEVLDPDADPLLAPPIYGRWHAGRTTVAANASFTGGGRLGRFDWLDQLNLDPRHRSVAAFGTQVVQEHQEALMAAAWEQAGDVQHGNQQRRQLQMSLYVGKSFHARHFDKLSDEALLRVAAPAFSRIRLPGAALRAGTRAAVLTVSAELGGTALPLRAASPAMRRIARDRGPIARRLAALGQKPVAGLRLMLKLGSGAADDFVRPVAPDVITFVAVRVHLPNPALIRVFQAVNDETVRTRIRQPRFAIVPEGQTVPMPQFVPGRPPDSAAAAAFRAAAAAHLEAIDAGRLGISVFMKPPMRIGELRAALIEQTAPERTLVALARAQMTVATARAQPRPGAPPIEPVMFAPSFRQPMYEPLRDLSQELLLPGLDAVLPNSAIGLVTNRRFVEAYMVGLNVEMAHELLWRGYPTDQRGTYFDRFWDSRASTAARADITPIHAWGTRRLADADGAPERERFVLLLRSDLIRRYPGSVVYATPAVLDSNGVRGPSPDPAREAYPAFRGSIPPDVTFFGFDLTVDQMVGGGADPGHYVVIQEQPTEPRFGFDVGTAFAPGTHVSVAAGPPPGLPPPGLSWGLNAAQMAAITRQLPVRIAIHASMLMRRT